ncbi:hypothetical protein KP509_13G047100 [Ceratopteris richardii]|uniref:Bulb-type lectin domain-containing protein n=1 Tax=Ceratopteris richardii TaxID=49495 RepID=A0A8T2TDA0_CERRI|nr:hypothetical protein KP509_13G047100 [Ceratopteris richardii]
MELCRRSVETVVATVVLVVLIASGRGQAADVLLEGYTLRAGAALVQGRYKFIMQSDCNLVLYKNGNQPLWASNTYRKGTGCVFTLQYDGNAVLYSGTRKPLFATNTYGRNDGSHYIIMQADGNVVMYNGSGRPIWSTGTYGRAFTELKPLDAAALQRLRQVESAGVR